MAASHGLRCHLAAIGDIPPAEFERPTTMLLATPRNLPEPYPGHANVSTDPGRFTGAQRGRSDAHLAGTAAADLDRQPRHDARPQVVARPCPRRRGAERAPGRGAAAARRRRVVAATTSPTGDTLLDEVLAEVTSEQRSRTLTWWVNRLASRHGGRRSVRDRLIDQLTERGVLTSGERRVLGLVPVADPASAERARAAIGEVLLGHQEPDERSAALVALVQVSGPVDVCVPDAERRRARRRARQITAGDEVGEAVKRIQEEVIAAVTAAVVASSAAASSGGSSG